MFKGIIYSDADTAIFIARRTLHITQDLANDKLIADAYFNIGVAHYFKEEYSDALRNSSLVG